MDKEEYIYKKCTICHIGYNYGKVENIVTNDPVTQESQIFGDAVKHTMCFEAYETELNAIN
jgi:hypothetical protein